MKLSASSVVLLSVEELHQLVVKNLGLWLAIDFLAMITWNRFPRYFVLRIYCTIILSRWNSFWYYTLLWNAMLAQWRRPFSNITKVCVVLVALRNNDLVCRHAGAATAHTLVLMVVLLIPWNIRLLLSKISQNIGALLENFFAIFIIIERIIHRTFIILNLNTIIRKRSDSSRNFLRFKMTIRSDTIMWIISWINMIVLHKDILKWASFSQSKFIRRSVRPVW